jgi:hypothetical protein
LFVAAMRDDAGRLLLITHSNSFERLKDSQGMAGVVRALHAVALTGQRLIVASISASGRLKLIVWLVRSDGSIVRLFDNGDGGPVATTVGAVALGATAGSQRVAVVSKNGAGKLVLSLWRVGSGSVEPVADSGQQIGEGDFGQVVVAPSGHLVVVCRDAENRLTLIPFEIDADGTGLRRIAGAEARAGKVLEVAATRRGYGLLTSVINASGNILLIKWSVDPDGRISRLGDSGDQAGKGSQLSLAALPFTEKATVCTAVCNGSGKLLPITWDDSDGPGELHLD